MRKFAVGAEKAANIPSAFWADGRLFVILRLRRCKACLEILILRTSKAIGLNVVSGLQ
jgi:hypothetical protein